MKLSAEIIIKEDTHNIQKLFEAEEKTFANQRAGYELKKIKDTLIFKIQAEDSIALKAVLNSITKLLTVYETSKSLICRLRKSFRFSGTTKEAVSKK